MKKFLLLTMMLAASGLAFCDSWTMALHDPGHSATTSEIVTPPLSLSWSYVDPLTASSPLEYYLPLYYNDNIFLAAGKNDGHVIKIAKDGTPVWSVGHGPYVNNYHYPCIFNEAVYIGWFDFLGTINTIDGQQNTFSTCQGGTCPGACVPWGNSVIMQYVSTDDIIMGQAAGCERLCAWGNPLFVGGVDSYPPDLNPAPPAKVLPWLWGPFRIPAIDRDVVYAINYGRLSARNAFTGDFKWMANSNTLDGTIPAAANGIVYFYDKGSQKLCAVDSESSKDLSTVTKWSVSVANAYTPVVSNGIVYVGSSDKKFYAFDALTGAQKWSYTTGAALTGMQMPAVSGNVIYLPGADGYLYMIDKTTGLDASAKLQVTAAAGGLGPVMIAGGKVFTSDKSPKFYAFQPLTSAVGSTVSGVSPALGVNDRPATLDISGTGFFAGGSSSAVTAVSLSNGTALSGYGVLNDTFIKGAVIPSGVPAGSYFVRVTTTTGVSPDSAQINIITPSTFWIKDLGPADIDVSSSGYIGTEASNQRHVVRTGSGALIAFYLGSNFSDWEGSRYQAYNISTDNGASWSAQVPLDNSLNSHPYHRSNGQSFAVTVDKADNIYVLYSGLYFEKYKFDGTGQLKAQSSVMPVLAGTGTTLCSNYGGVNSLLRTDDGRIWVSMFDSNNGYNTPNDAYAAFSIDEGVTWTKQRINNQSTSWFGTKIYTSMVPQNGKPVCFMDYDNGGYLSYTKWNGSSWGTSMALPGNISGVGENFSVTVTKDNVIHLVYQAGGNVLYINDSGTGSWTAPVTLSSGGINPALTTDGTGLWCFYSNNNNIAFKKSAAGSFSGSEAETFVVTDGSVSNKYSFPAAAAASIEGIPVVWTNTCATTVTNYRIKGVVLPNGAVTPLVTSVNPGSVRNDINCTVNITGSGFSSGVLRVMLSDGNYTGLSGYSVIGDTMIQGAVVPAGVTLGTYNVQVATWGGLNRNPSVKLSVANPPAVSNVIADLANGGNTDKAPQRHIERFADGNFIAVFYDNGYIKYSVSPDKGQTWTTPVSLSDNIFSGANTEKSSSIFRDQSDNIYIVYCGPATNINTVMIAKLTYSGGAVNIAGGFPKDTGITVSAAFNGFIAPMVVKEAPSAYAAGGRLWISVGASDYTTNCPYCYTRYSDNDAGSWSFDVPAQAHLGHDWWSGGSVGSGYHYNGAITNGILLLRKGLPAFIGLATYSMSSYQEWTCDPSTGVGSWSSVVLPGDVYGPDTSTSAVVTADNQVHCVWGNGEAQYFRYDGTAWANYTVGSITMSGVDEGENSVSFSTDGTNLWAFFNYTGGVYYKVVKGPDYDFTNATRYPLYANNSGHCDLLAARGMSAPGDDVPVIWTETRTGGNVIGFGKVTGIGGAAVLPVLSVPSVSAGTTSATVTWNTDKFSDTQVEYGLTSAYTASTNINTTLVTNHSAVIGNLLPGTSYHFQARSADMSGNLGAYADATFNTVAVGPVPTVAIVSPATAANSAPVTLSITGTNYYGGTSSSKVTAIGIKNGIYQYAATSYNVLSDSIANGIVVPAGSRAGTYDVLVTDQAGTNSASAQKLVITAASPSISAITPASALFNNSVTVSITGAGFFGGSSSADVTGIHLTSNPVTYIAGFTVASNTLITGVVVPSGVAIGSYNMIVTTDGGDSTEYPFSVIPSAPVVASIAPSSGYRHLNITANITGSGFFGGVGSNSVTALQLTGPSNITISAFTVTSDTQISNAVIPAGSQLAGVYDVQVTTAGGTNATSAGKYTVQIDATAPTVLTTYASTGLVTVTFSEDMNVAEAGNKANYTLKSPGSTLVNLSGATVTYSAQVATISGLSLNFTDTYTVTVSNVHDLAGNLIGSPNSGSGTVSGVDTTPPTGTVVINGGNAFTGSTTVTLTLLAMDSQSGMSQMQFSNDNSSWSTPETYGISKVWTILTGDGLKTVYVKYKDVAGNWTVSTISSTITLDGTAPTGTINVNSGAAYTRTSLVTLNLTAADAGSGVAQMQVDPGSGVFNAAESFTGTKVVSISGADGQKAARIKYIDAVGNTSVVYSKTIKLNTTDHLSVAISGIGTAGVALDPGKASSGEVITLSITARKADNMVNPGYNDTVKTAYTDAAVNTVSEVTFLETDTSKTITIVPNTIGKQTITVTDKDIPEVKAGTLTVDVLDVNTVDASKDFTIENIDGSSVFIPAGTLPNNTAVYIKVPDILPGMIKSYKYRATTNPIGRDFGVIDRTTTPWIVKEMTFNGQVSITIPYTKADVGNMDESCLRIFYYNANTVKYELMPGDQLIANGKVTAKTAHFSTYRIAGTYLTTNLSAVNAYPNPFNPNTAFDKAFKVLNIPQDSEVAVYTITGNKVRTVKEADMTAPNQGWIEWDGKNDAGEIVAAGVYVVTIKTASEKKIIKVAVVK